MLARGSAPARGSGRERVRPASGAVGAAHFQEGSRLPQFPVRRGQDAVAVVAEVSAAAVRQALHAWKEARNAGPDEQLREKKRIRHGRSLDSEGEAEPGGASAEGV